MSAPRGTTWELQPHSLGKHLVLQEYLKAWLPILGQTQGRIVFLDGFAGPGEYAQGEEGSPTIALKAFLEHSARQKITAEVRFVFIEKHKGRARHLDGLIQPLARQLPPGSVEIVCGAFDETVTRELDSLADAGETLPPCFAMVDPFGIRDTPMDVLRRILAHEKSEVYVSVMCNHIDRFDEEPGFIRHLDSLYGCNAWRACAQIAGHRERLRCIVDLYKRQLKNAGAKQVIHFDLYDGRQHKYSIFHASRHVLASNKMKAAIWKVDPGGSFTFRGGQAEQLTLGVDPNFQPLQETLRTEFRGKGWVTIKEVKDFVRSDRTDYHESQLRANALTPMEDRGEIEVRGAPKRKPPPQATLPGLLDEEAGPRPQAHAYPPGATLRIR